MPFRWNPREHVSLARYFVKWVVIASPVGALVGAAVALFLWRWIWQRAHDGIIRGFCFCCRLPGWALG